MKLLSIDTETGGLSPINEDLLSIGLAVWEDGVVGKQKEILVKGTRVTQAAMMINKINLEEHNKNALEPSAAPYQMIKFVTEENLFQYPVILLGHNIHHDVSFLRAHFQRHSKLIFNSYFSYRTVDTMSILYFLFEVGIIEKRLDTLDQALIYFGLPLDRGTRHTALGDALHVCTLYNHLLKITREHNKKKKKFLFW